MFQREIVSAWGPKCNQSWTFPSTQLRTVWLQPSTCRGNFSGWKVSPEALAKGPLIMDLVHPLSICATADTGFGSPWLCNWTCTWKVLGFCFLLILLILFFAWSLAFMVFDLSWVKVHVFEDALLFSHDVILASPVWTMFMTGQTENLLGPHSGSYWGMALLHLRSLPCPFLLHQFLSLDETNPQGLGVKGLPWALGKFEGGFRPRCTLVCSDMWPVDFWMLCLLLKSLCMSNFSLYAGLTLSWRSYGMSLVRLWTWTTSLAVVPAISPASLARIS